MAPEVWTPELCLKRNCPDPPIVCEKPQRENKKNYLGGLTRRTDKKIFFLKFCFLIFWRWLKELAILDVRIGFYVSNCAFSQLEMSIGLNFTSITKHSFFKNSFFSQTSLDEGFQKNLATSEPNEEKGQNLRPEIQETDDLRNKRRRKRKRIVPKNALFKFAP